jgi:hypothetical protein
MKKIKVNQLGPILKGLSELAGDDFTKILQKLSIDAFRELIMRSAKDTGFLRSNWAITTGSPTEGSLKNSSKSSFSPASYPNTKIEADDKVIIYNNTAYAMYLEEGTPRMRAQPMVEPTYQRLYSQAEKLSKLLTKEKYNV